MTSLLSRINNMIQEFLNTGTDDSKAIQLVSGSGANSSSREKMERLQPYGLSTNAPKGSPMVGATIGANADRYVIICCDGGQYRVKELEEGEVCLYHKGGQKLYFKNDGSYLLEDALGNTMVSNSTGVLINDNLEVLQ